MASSKDGKGHKNNCIVISNPKVTMQSNKRILKLDDTEFLINEERMIATSNFLKRMLIEKKKVIVLNDLKEKEPCFDGIGLAIAISFANGYAEIPLNQIISALAAANALEMWTMRRAISEQLCILAAQPESAPFAINVATCNLEKDTAKHVVKQSLGKFDEVIKQNSFLAINDSSFEFFISLFIYEHSSTIDKHEKQSTAESAAQAIKLWCGSDNQRHAFAKNILSKLRPSCDFNIVDHIERLIAPNSAIHSLRDKVEMINDTAAQHNELKITHTTAGDPNIDSDESLKFEAFRQIELPAAEPDENGIRHYSFIVEFEAPKELLISNKPKFIGLQLEAILECPNQ
ncbi:unnamed protein product [Cercopithifilaria johnstoni]|uniref:Uncharacterized protein n=1 Tax=Cercopithifilaria johnstoni TaxID=2874296 RepID=A0A8J2M173_9BILA|nr:unnamed protein product [Cercopithifilaria johnstoni]